MIAIQKIGKSFMGAFLYNMNKFYHPDQRLRAELLATNFASLEKGIVRKEVNLVRAMRPNLSRYVYHTSLNFSNEELQSLNNEKLKAIAEDYLFAMGFTNNQYMIFRHYDAGHPHIHLLVNRIGFDGNVISDSNNYRKSEKVLRALEYRYNLKAVEQSKFVAFKPSNGVSFELKNTVRTDQGIVIARKQYNGVTRRVNRDEIAMMSRKGKVSDKLLLQEVLSQLLGFKPKSVTDFIRIGEKAGVNFLFNQASTGRVSGVTYFFKDFKAKGQALGNQFKWWELIKNVPYNPERDNAAISEANKHTLSKFNLTAPNTQEELSNGKKMRNTNDENQQLDDAIQFLPEVDFDYTPANERSVEAGDNFYPIPDIAISDDIDDEAILGRNRRRKHHPRTNSR
ncbi:MAG: relaxase/mobilization nuclease domain-containing protein [Bacteroidetes bacterium]|nr:relaxase/mobilization nuclease domain-containing protein [Bacteroidota bacterium]